MATSWRALPPPRLAAYAPPMSSPCA